MRVYPIRRTATPLLPADVASCNLQPALHHTGGDIAAAGLVAPTLRSHFTLIGHCKVSLPRRVHTKEFFRQSN